MFYGRVSLIRSVGDFYTLMPQILRSAADWREAAKPKPGLNLLVDDTKKVPNKNDL